MVQSQQSCLAKLQYFAVAVCLTNSRSPRIDLYSSRTDTLYHVRLVLKSSSDRLLGLAALPSVILVDQSDADGSMDLNGEVKEAGQLLMMTSGVMLKACVDVEKVRKFEAE